MAVAPQTEAATGANGLRASGQKAKQLKGSELEDEVLGELLALGWTPQEQQDLDDIFAIFDRDGDGNITRAEIYEACGWLGIAHEGNDDLAQMIDAADKNNDDKIDSGEFTDMLMRYPAFVMQVVRGMGSETGAKFTRRRLAEQAALASASVDKAEALSKARGAGAAGGVSAGDTGDFDEALALKAMHEFSNVPDEFMEVRPELITHDKLAAVLTDEKVLGAGVALGHEECTDLLKAAGVPAIPTPYNAKKLVASMVR